MFLILFLFCSNITSFSPSLLDMLLLLFLFLLSFLFFITLLLLTFFFSGPRVCVCVKDPIQQRHMCLAPYGSPPVKITLINKVTHRQAALCPICQFDPLEVTVSCDEL